MPCEPTFRLLGGGGATACVLTVLIPRETPKELTRQDSTTHLLPADLAERGFRSHNRGAWSKEMEWRRRESNPHFRDATAVCSRYTTSPRVAEIAILPNNRANPKTFSGRLSWKLRTPIFHSRVSFLSAHGLALSAHRLGNPRPSAQLL
jgi:hypothetical protein